MIKSPGLIKLGLGLKRELESKKKNNIPRCFVKMFDSKVSKYHF